MLQLEEQLLLLLGELLVEEQLVLQRPLQLLLLPGHLPGTHKSQLYENMIFLLNKSSFKVSVKKKEEEKYRCLSQNTQNIHDIVKIS